MRSRQSVAREIAHSSTDAHENPYGTDLRFQSAETYAVPGTVRELDQAQETSCWSTMMKL